MRRPNEQLWLCHNDWAFRSERSIPSNFTVSDSEPRLMPYYLTKILPLLFMPVPLVLLIGLLAAFFVWRGRRAAALVCLFVGIGSLWLASLPPVSSALLSTLQEKHPPTELAAIPKSDCLIVLGGVLGEAEYPRVEVELSETIDRVYQAAKLYRSGKASTIIVAAGNQPWRQDREPEANLIRNLLVEWGVPAAVVKLDATSRNTRENAVNSAQLILEAGCKSNLLVTSVWHMPRAVASFKAVDVTVFPVSVDVKGVQGSSLLATWFIPRAEALAVTSQVITEWMGIWVYRWRGWN